MPEIVQAGEFTLVRDFAIIMAVAGVAIILFRRLNQPPVLGYLIAGLIVGPFTLPVLGIQAPISNIESIRLLADLGLVLLLLHWVWTLAGTGYARWDCGSFSSAPSKSFS